MIYELEQQQFIRCKHLLQEERHLEVQAIIEGNNLGRVFVDHVAFPQSGLVWLGNLDGFTFIGNPNNESFNFEIKQFLNGKIAKEAIELGLHWFEGFGYGIDWDHTIRKILSGYSYEESNQKVYKLYENQYQIQNESKIDEGYTLLKITEESVIANRLYENSFFVSQLSLFWNSMESFFEKGIGYGLMYKNEIVSICFSGFVSENTHAVAIETTEEHRGKKLAQKVAHAFVQDCFANGKTPYWDCMEVNTPSIAIAESLGFVNVFNYIVYDYQFLLEGQE
ncbi:GNAT family N-acetyltransferase [Bacillus cereus group sp. BfR-BA-01380]|uniref:GNAT family N-acetyltransferase n=1 Tax=Bacillus cereus group sp. BfR-BA-01380 TaxID=2920324 RepID=UPI001F57744A|nr:GNAT family N-acetyltransferase [Bacillus cereus group sp. BfR-BA-01380]